MEALTVYSIYRLSACIHDLRKTGISIITQMKEDASGHRYARYEVLAWSTQRWPSATKVMIENMN